MIDEYQFGIPTNVIVGKGKITSVGEQAKGFGDTVLVVANRGAMRELGYLDRVVKSVNNAGLEVQVWDEVDPNPTTDKANEISKMAKNFGVDLVIGLGGGSAIDFAKAVAVGATHNGDIFDYVFRTGYEPQEVTERVLPVIAIPTTSGTGAEVTQNAVLTHPRTTIKMPVHHNNIIPKIAIIDPELTLSLPSDITASTGIDAFSHALEAYISLDRNPFAQLVAEKAMKLIFDNLRLAVYDGNNIEARQNMSVASTLAGIAITLSGTVLVHALGHPLSGRFNLAHGVAMAISLPVMLDNTWKVIPKELGRLGAIIEPSCVKYSKVARAKYFVKKIKELIEDVEMNISLTKFVEITNQDIDYLVEDVLGYIRCNIDNHPLKVNEAIIREMYKSLM